MDIKHFQEAFYAAAFWLHHIHPKMLLCNIPSFAGFGSINRSIAFFWDLVEILHNRPKTAVQRSHCDPHYKLLHNRVMDLLAEQLKFDIDKLKQHKRMLLESENDDKDGTTLLFFSHTAECCTPESPEEDHAAHAILLFESLGRRLFPP